MPVFHEKPDAEFLNPINKRLANQAASESIQLVARIKYWLIQLGLVPSEATKSIVFLARTLKQPSHLPYSFPTRNCVDVKADILFPKTSDEQGCRTFCEAEDKLC